MRGNRRICRYFGALWRREPLLAMQKVEGSNPLEFRAWCWAAFPRALPVSSGLGRAEVAGQDVGQIDRLGLLELRVAA
jgi:hypothetical protein